MKHYFPKGELALWAGSVPVLLFSFALFDGENYLTLFALLYAANDPVLILLWILASMEDPGYLSVVGCFAAFFANVCTGTSAGKK